MAGRDDRFAPGDVISIRFAGVLRHYGVVTARGTVISNSRAHGGVVEQTLIEFEAGRRARRDRTETDPHPFEIEARARRALGAGYDLTGSNCIDFTRHTHRRRPTAWQLGSATFMAVRDMWRGR